MLVSMTGFGGARRQSESLGCTVEVRSVNNRYLKVVSKLPENHAGLEPWLEKVVRQKVRRGTVVVQVTLEAPSSPTTYRLNRVVLQGYLAQLKEAGIDDRGIVGSVLSLPGVVEEPVGRADPHADWPTIQEALVEALENLDRMRQQEGQAMQQELRTCFGRMQRAVEEIEALVPQTVEDYRDRLHERVRRLLNESGVGIDPADLIKEVSIFAERSDIAEELARLRSHLAQARETIESSQGVGRMLEFLGQEMHRESNTMAAKAGDVRVGRLAIELKNEVERVREIIQNVE